jgi:hypothetical protein
MILVTGRQGPTGASLSRRSWPRAFGFAPWSRIHPERWTSSAPGPSWLPLTSISRAPSTRLSLASMGACCCPP